MVFIRRTDDAVLAGKPKAIIHSHLGMLLAIKTAAPLHGNLQVGDVQLQLSTWSWMMANHMTNHLSCGITLVLYDGSFLFPRQDTMFDLVEAFKSVT